MTAAMKHPYSVEVDFAKLFLMEDTYSHLVLVTKEEDHDNDLFCIKFRCVTITGHNEEKTVPYPTKRERDQFFYSQINREAAVVFFKSLEWMVKMEEVK